MGRRVTNLNPGPAILAFSVWNILAVNNAKLVLVVAEAELNVTRSFKIRLLIKKLRIPFPRRRMIGSKEADGAQSVQRDVVATWCPPYSRECQTPDLGADSQSR